MIKHLFKKFLYTLILCIFLLPSSIKVMNATVANDNKNENESPEIEKPSKIKKKPFYRNLYYSFPVSFKPYFLGSKDLKTSYIPLITPSSPRSTKIPSFGISTFNSRFAFYFAPLKSHISPVISAGIDLGRKASYSDAQYKPISGLGEIKTAALVGGGIRTYIKNIEILTLAYYDITGNRKGIDAELRTSTKLTLANEKLFIKPSLITRFGNARFLNSLFGITQSQASTSDAGYTDTYQTKTGFYAIGADIDMRYFIEDDVFIRLKAGYTRLLKKASDSPIIQLYGNKDQFNLGISLNFNLNLK